MRLNVRLTVFAERNTHKSGAARSFDVDNMVHASALWRIVRGTFGLDCNDVVSVTVTDKMEHVGSVSWHGSIYGSAGPGLGSSEMPLLYRSPEVAA